MKAKSPIKRIIAGKYKNKPLKLPSKETTRSSKSIVLESLFNTLGFDIVDEVFVELFSGSGSVGLEALSRGASNIVFMERDRDAVAVLKENISQTDPAKCEIVFGDSFVNIDGVVNRLFGSGQKAFFYIDPPFSIRENMGDIYDKTIDLIASLPDKVVHVVIVEHMSDAKMPEKIGSFLTKKRRKFGNTTLTYYTME